MSRKKGKSLYVQNMGFDLLSRKAIEGRVSSMKRVATVRFQQEHNTTLEPHAGVLPGLPWEELERDMRESATICQYEQSLYAFKHEIRNY